jgi:hypothetical protein
MRMLLTRAYCRLLRSDGDTHIRLPTAPGSCRSHACSVCAVCSTSGCVRYAMPKTLHANAPPCRTSTGPSCCSHLPGQSVCPHTDLELRVSARFLKGSTAELGPRLLGHYTPHYIFHPFTPHLVSNTFPTKVGDMENLGHSHVLESIPNHRIKPPRANGQCPTLHPSQSCGHEHMPPMPHMPHMLPHPSLHASTFTTDPTRRTSSYPLSAPNLTPTPYPLPPNPEPRTPYPLPPTPYPERQRRNTRRWPSLCCSANL